MKDNINVGLIGFGTVGTGIVKYFKEKNPAGINLKTVVVKDINKPREIEFSNLTTDINKVLKDPEIDIVVEVIGGEQAINYILEAIENGKSVVTANKLILSKYWKEIFKKAKEKKINVGFEASVAASIPIIKLLKESLPVNKISKILAILNGTTNYILTRMTEGSDYNSALKLAQAKGFAEANPEFDVSGKDAAQKLSIIASLAYNTHISPEQIYCEGITQITLQDIDFAKEEGYAIKLLAIAKKNKWGIRIKG